MRNAIRPLRWILLVTFTLGLVVLVGCAAGAADTDAGTSAALTASPTPNGGVLACSATHSDGASTIRSTILFSNDDDAGSIQVDRVVVYGRDGKVACTIASPMVLGPHQMGSVLTSSLAWCLPQGQGGGAGKVRFVVYWSRDGNRLGTANPLDGWTEITTTDASGVPLAKIARDCKAITLPPDRCLGVTCRTADVCGQQGACEICVNGKCVVNEPHYDAACRPSCGEASRLCGITGLCDATNGQCVPVPTWDCATCCTQP
ncbi:MAG TPA: hypothetical protein VFM53_13640 [Anaeromyxobacteraceae bacterium]|nr:hypothetical protein [Anaeromyxobacteraceae bacterium]